ncbi:MAG TPA: hypothetical protein VHS33_06910 [Sphingomicrobium sp.]|jgi:hypothetical protein|nr:hypothetical protein [Sphingomicrobium sp.]
MLLSVVAALALAAQSTAATELLGIDVPNEFQVGSQARNEHTEIIELVQPPETVNDWSRMITSLMFFNAAPTGLEIFYGQWRAQERSGCPSMTDTRVSGTVDGHRAIRGTLSCPKDSQTGKAENLSAFLVQGDANLMMVEVAFRGAFTPADDALIERIKGSLKVCDERELKSCSARKPRGFVASK